MEPTFTTSQSFDIKPASTSGTAHHSRKVVIIASLVLCILAAVLIFMRIKQKRAYEAYVRTPEGQLAALKATSMPVTTTPEEQYTELEALQKSGKSSEISHEDQIRGLNALEQ